MERPDLTRDTLWAALEARILWLTVKRAAAEMRACRDYTVRDEGGCEILTARAFPWRREIPFYGSTSPHAPALLLRRRRSLPLTGRADLLDAVTGTPLGSVRRSGRLCDARGRGLGRFRDARSARDLLKEGAVVAVMEAMVGGEGTTASGPTGFVLLAAGRPIGTLRRARAPFAADHVQVPGPRTRFVRRAFPKPLADWLLDRSSGGSWRLEHDPRAAGRAPRLPVAAALFVVELSHG